MWIVIALAALSLGYLLWDALHGFWSGTCTPGCGYCSSKTCGVKKLQAIHTALDQPKPRIMP
jgi:hypothetical protein